MQRILSALIGLIAACGIAYAVATTPPVNSPLVSMAGGTAPSSIWATTARQSMASTSDVSCFSATGQGAPGGLTIPASGPYIGNQYQLSCAGIYSVPALNAATLVLKLKWGSTAVATSGNILPSASLSTNLAYTIMATCTVATIGATGSMECVGQACFSAGLLGASLSCGYFLTAAPVTINTTIDSKIDITAAWSSVAGGQTMTTIIGQAMILF